MDIHRCRFVPYPPQAINALAFSQASDTQKPCPPDQRLAIGRANGDIEIWNPAQGLWSQETIFRGGMDRSIEGLAWTQDLPDAASEDGELKEGGKLRLFSIGLSSAVTEWDLTAGIPLRHANGNFGAIWCLAAQPRWTSSCGNEKQHNPNPIGRQDQYLAAGCEDGTIVLFSTEDGDLRYLRTIAKPPTKKPRILSLTWKDRNTIIAGCSDSNIRVYDIRSRQALRNMTLGRSAIGGNETLVWAVKCRPDGTILSGDSAGDLKIWDSNNYSLVQRLHCHEADILDIATDAAGSTIITGGADRRTVAYKSMSGDKDGMTRRWTQLMHRRFHKHDVKALASFESQDLSIVVSGGLDTVPVVMPLRGWQREHHRTLSHLPQTPQVSSASQTRLFISWWERQISIWHLSQHAELSEVPEALASSPTNHKLLAQLLLKGEENITSAQISNNGSYIAAATVSQVKMFRLQLKRTLSDGGINIRTKKVETLPSLERFGARLVAFSPDSRWLCSIRLNNEIILVRIEDSLDFKEPPLFNKHAVKLKRTKLRTSRDSRNGYLGEYMDTITTTSFSADSRILAVGDLSGRIATWVLEGLERNNDGVVNGIHNDRGSGSPRSSNCSSSGESSSDEEDDSEIIHGQRWRKNPAASYLPNLGASILVLTFRPSQRETQINTARSEIGLHPTRHNPHPHAHDLPTGEDRLIAMTAEHKLVEFRVLQGMLSEWSRRNPASYLPQQFQQLRERAMGCFWDVSSLRDRLWLYGSTWMFMLDLTQDLPFEKPGENVGMDGVQQAQQSSKQNKKRKREQFEAEKWRKRGSGAGGAVPFSESYVGVSNLSRKFKSLTQEDSQMIQLNATHSAAGDEDEGSGLGLPALAQLRRRSEQPLVNGDAEHQASTVPSHFHETSQSNAPPSKRGNDPASFVSLRYRSILGIVPLGGTGDEDTRIDIENRDGRSDPESGFEVAIIERPLWDVDLPPRFDGNQDWET